MTVCITTGSRGDLEVQINDLVHMATIAHYQAHQVVCEENDEAKELCLFSVSDVLDRAEKLLKTFYWNSASSVAERAAARRDRQGQASHPVRERDVPSQGQYPSYLLE